MLSPCHQRDGLNHTISATPRQTGAVQALCTQNTGAPIKRSRTVPPPTPVTTAKNAIVTNVCRIRAASSAPLSAVTAMPAGSSAAISAKTSEAGTCGGAGRLRERTGIGSLNIELRPKVTNLPLA